MSNFSLKNLLSDSVPLGHAQPSGSLTAEKALDTSASRAFSVESKRSKP